MGLRRGWLVGVTVLAAVGLRRGVARLVGLPRRLTCRAMVQQAVQGGAPAAYAQEMERLTAKESLLLAVSLKF